MSGVYPYGRVCYLHESLVMLVFECECECGPGVYVGGVCVCQWGHSARCCFENTLCW